MYRQECKRKEMLPLQATQFHGRDDKLNSRENSKIKPNNKSFANYLISDSIVSMAILFLTLQSVLIEVPEWIWPVCL